MNYQKLFNYMSEEHGVTLLEQDMQEIRNIVNEMQSDELHQPLVSGSLADLLAEFLIDTNKRGTIGRGKYVDIAKDFLKSRGVSQ